jgi:peptidyl-prolyl cis-trans isomerase SurA
MNKSITGAAVAAVLVACAAAPRAEIIEQIIVKVNGDIITKTEFEQRQVNVLRQRNQTFSDQSELQQAIAEVTPRLIVEAVDELLLLQRGRDLGYRLSDEQFTTVVEQIRKENKLESDEQFQAALKQEGMSMADLRRSLERQMIVSRVQGQEVMSKIGLSEEEALAYHAEHIDEFTQPGAVTLREIFVAVPAAAQGVNVAADEEARETIEALRKRVLDGEAFETVAAEASTAPSRANGGLIGPLNDAELNPALQKLLGTMKPGDISEVLRTPTGYQILKLEARTEPQVLSAEQARDQIADRLYDQKRRQELRRYLTRLRGQAIIEWKNQEMRKAYEAGLADMEQRPAPASAPGVPDGTAPSN